MAICSSCKHGADLNSAAAEQEDRGRSTIAEEGYRSAARLHELCEGPQKCVCQHRTGAHWIVKKESDASEQEG